ncbi:hypothetical protein ACHAW5_001148 [Stephanodiscus triporus]|uniref:RNA polymerase sigma-70 region 2 domain-containing protein n=1 Tax=Stephanodiscus triporus TaxID=2934178 RepID=A0ABD3QQC7_9STRA
MDDGSANSRGSIIIRCRRRRRRGGIALAAAAAATILAASRCPSSLAFSSSSSSSSSVPPSCRRGVDVAADDVDRRPPPRVGRGGAGRRSSSSSSSRAGALGMVSYLEAPAASVARRPPPPDPKKGKTSSSSSSSSSSLSGVPRRRIGAAAEIEPRLHRALLDDRRPHDDSTPPPRIDIEILREGSIVTAAATTTTTGAPRGGPAVASTSDGEPALRRKIVANKTAGGKSSTMPGFIRDEDDARVADRIRRGQSPLRPTRVMVRTNNTKESTAAKLNKRTGTTAQQQQQRQRLRRRRTNSESMYRNSATVPDSLLDYARDFHAVSRVTPREEVELGARTQEAERLRRLHVDLSSRYGRDPTDDEWCAAAGKVNALALREAMEDGLEAKNQLVASNLRMVQRVVNLYIRNGLGSEYNAGDLMQDGTMALIRAAEKYEPDRGFRFSTYAMYWIRSAVKRSQTTQSRIVTVPQRIHETHKRVSREEGRLRRELGRYPTKAELANACDITVLQLRRCRAAMGQVTYSLDAEVRNAHKPNGSNSRRDTMYDIVEGTVDETEYERTQRLLMKEHLIGTLRRYLLPQEVDLLLLRYGLMDERALPRGMSGPLTIAEVSDLVGLKPDKVRRIIINSQKQLKHLMKEWEDFEYEIA